MAVTSTKQSPYQTVSYYLDAPIAIGIVACNNKHLTARTINSVMRGPSRSDCIPGVTRVCVFDNASDDGTQQWLSARAKGINQFHWWSTLKRKSLAACWNIMIQSMISANYRLFLILNNDVELLPKTAELLRNAMTTHLRAGRSVGLMTGISQVSESELALWRPDMAALDNARPHPDFSCFLLNLDCIKTVGWFDEEYFPAYCEDNDYHVRMHRAGVEALCVNVPFLHNSAGANTIKSSTPEDREMIRRGAGKNANRFKDLYGCLPTDPQYTDLFK